MSAEPNLVTSNEPWSQWENRVVNGDFPVRRLLGSSDHSAVFLTEHPAKNLPDAAIKLLRADAPGAKGQLDRWRAAATLSYPQLVRVFDAGRCWSEQHEFVFVVMEYAEQTLAHILRRRPLHPDEIREMLPSALNALAFLHRNALVHSRLKPSNLLIVNDQLKLTIDTLRPPGYTTDAPVTTSSYDPPELKDHGTSTAGDVWSLGMTLVEALTQRTTAWPDPQCDVAALPASLPTAFAGLVRRCLSLDPADRPTAAELMAPSKTAARVERPTPSRAPARQSLPDEV